MEHLQAEGSDEFDAGMDVMIDKSNSNSFNQSAEKGQRNGKVQYEVQTNGNKTKGGSQQQYTMFINGKPIVLNKTNHALNKREKSNWLVHLLFIRQEYNECMKFLDLLI